MDLTSVCRCGAPAPITCCRFPKENDEHFCVRCMDIPEEWRERWWSFLKELAVADSLETADGLER